MNITHIQTCADFFQENYLKTFYLVITYNGKSFILTLFHNILNRAPIHTSIIPSHISSTSKMYKKALNFQKSTDIFWKNSGPLTINYNPALSSTNLNHVNVLLTDIETGYMLGWVSNARVPVNGNINLEKYCICTWIDESSSSVQGREKYMSGQDVELIRYVFSFNADSKLSRKKEYSYNYTQKLQILLSCERNNCNLLLDSGNAHFYTSIATHKHIHCKINSIQY